MRRALHARNGASVTLQRCIDVYERGDVMLGVLGRMETFSAFVSLFDKRIRSEPDELKRLINSVVCMKLELPLSTFPDAVLLNLAISYKSNVPQSQSFTAKARMDGPADFIHPVPLLHWRQRCMRLTRHFPPERDRQWSMFFSL